MSQENGQAAREAAGSAAGTAVGSTKEAVGTLSNQALPNQAPRPGSEHGNQRRDGRQGGGELQRATKQDGGGDLVTEHGRTSIADSVVAKIVGMAAREIGGVHAMGKGMTRAFGAVKERLGGGEAVDQGVSVEVGERQAAVDLDLVVEYGVAIPDLAAAVRENVINEVEHMTGLEVVEVNITVDDIHMPGDDKNDDSSGDGDSVKDKVRDKAEDAKDSVKDAARDAKDAATEKRRVE